MYSLFCVCCVMLSMHVLSFYCAGVSFLLCPIVLSLSSVVLCFALFKGDWMEI